MRLVFLYERKNTVYFILFFVGEIIQIKLVYDNVKKRGVLTIVNFSSGFVLADQKFALSSL